MKESVFSKFRMESLAAVVLIGMTAMSANAAIIGFEAESGTLATTPSDIFVGADAGALGGEFIDTSQVRAAR